MEMLEKLSLAGIVPVIKVEDAADAVPLCKALSDGGLPVAEITFRTPCAAEAISLITKECPDMLVGAGTVLSIGSGQRAASRLLTDEDRDILLERMGADVLLIPDFDTIRTMTGREFVREILVGRLHAQRVVCG